MKVLHHPCVMTSEGWALVTTFTMKCGLRGQQVCKDLGDLGPHSSSLCANMGKSGVMGLKEPGGRRTQIVTPLLLAT